MSDAAPRDVTIIDLGERHAFNPERIAALGEALDGVAPGDAAAFTAHGRVWSSGLDLEWIAAHPADRELMIAELHRLLGRIVVSPTITVAVISGHAFGGGAFLALACDFRVMRADRGYFCFPEVDLDLPPTAPMVDLVVARVGRTSAARALLSGRRLTAPEAVELGLVDRAVPDDQLLDAAHALVAPFVAKPPRSVAVIKRRVWGDVSSRLTAYAAD